MNELRTRAPALAAVALVVTLASAGAAEAKPPVKEPPPPPVDVRVRVVAPTATGPWTLRLENAGATVVRVPADVRLLSLDVEVRDKKRLKKITCSVPDAMRPSAFPEARALFLQPGESYVEEFDPHLLCFGKTAIALQPNALVRPRFGWKQPAWKKTQEPPYAAQENAKPEAFAAQRELKAPTMLLSFAQPEERAELPSPAPPPPDKPLEAGKEPTSGAKTSPEADKPVPTDKPIAKPAPTAPAAPAAAKGPQPEPAPAIVDVHAPALEVVPDEYVDATAARNASFRVSVTNVGDWPTHVVLRNRMLELFVEGPDGRRTCEAIPYSGAVPRDNFRQLKPKQSSSLSVLLQEACARKPLQRPGLYRVRARLHAAESGRHVKLDAFTGVVPTKRGAYVRLATGPEPFYRDPPRATPAPDSPGDE